MDDVRGTFGTNENTDHTEEWETNASQSAHDGPPPGIGQDERRMQVRAYNHWAGLLGERNFPSIEELDPSSITDFGPNSVLLDFSVGIENPAVQYLGDKLAEECGATGPIHKLSDVPARSLLSRITDHYMQILANEAPIGFEAEFVNRDGAAILYRGILLPYSSDDETIDFIYGVINWKEMADQATADELLLEIDQALEAEEVEEEEASKHPADPVTAWEPSSLGDFDELSDLAPENDDSAEPTLNDDEPDVFELELAQVQEDDLDVAAETDSEETSQSTENPAGKTASLLDIGGCDAAFDHQIDDEYDLPDFSQYKLDAPDEEEEDYDEEFESGEDEAAYHFASLADYLETPTKKAIDLDADVEMKTPETFDAEAHNDEAATEEPADLSGEFELSDEVEEEPAANAPLELSDMLEVEETDAEADEDSTEEVGDTSPILHAIDTTGEDVETPASSESDTVQASSLYDHLASARELAETAIATEDRSRQALYAAVSRAYDFSLAAQEAPEDYEELIAESGLSVQERAPMTPIVKLVFGSEYDKTRVTEYAAVLSHAHRLELSKGALNEFLAEAEGGLKGVVQDERRLRREEAGKPVDPKDAVRVALAEKLRELEELALEQLSAEGPEFALVMVRRDGEGGVSVVGEIDDDIPLIERAAKKLVG
ncbi:hypothetical protein [Erythrobacter sp. YT30]|uniref:PAS domain-containing protein n=1 Tax=Erythrobacter sp. YT30 TaxID=1735012 RepID=UPI00076C5EC6|nr:hypothetical protein AUC45_09490 [Erythrobacter sp. YT30]